MPIIFPNITPEGLLRNLDLASAVEYLRRNHKSKTEIAAKIGVPAHVVGAVLAYSDDWKKFVNDHWDEIDERIRAIGGKMRYMIERDLENDDDDEKD
jgi:hypothetical protein